MNVSVILCKYPGPPWRYTPKGGLEGSELHNKEIQEKLPFCCTIENLPPHKAERWWEFHSLQSDSTQLRLVSSGQHFRNPLSPILYFADQNPSEPLVRS